MTKSTVAAGLTPRIFDTSYTSLRKGTLYSRTPLLPPPPFPNFFPLIFFSQHPLPFRVSRFAYSSPHRYIWTRPHPPPPVEPRPAYRPGAQTPEAEGPGPLFYIYHPQTVYSRNRDYGQMVPGCAFLRASSSIRYHRYELAV